MRTFLATSAFCALLAFAPSAQARIVQSHQTATAMPAVQKGEEEAVGLFVRALREIRGQYVEDISDRQLVEIAIQAMAGRDRWSKYMSDEQFQEFESNNKGESIGVGIRYKPEDGHYRVLEVLPNSPALKANIQKGDEIVAVNGHNIAGQNEDDVRSAIRGKAGSDVTFTLARVGKTGTFDAKMVREVVTVPSVTSAVIGQVGYIRISKFDRQTYPGVSAAISALKSHAGSSLSGLVLDLRNNPGGLVEASVKVADAFLNDGTILTSKGRIRRANAAYSAKPGDEAKGLPITVLVNEKSASASEILAGALKDHGRAKLVGTKTYGKGVIQSLTPLPEGGAIKLTTARYYTPSGQSIHEIGITPDVVVAETDADKTQTDSWPNPVQDVQLAKALQLLEQPAVEPMPVRTKVQFAAIEAQQNSAQKE